MVSATATEGSMRPPLSKSLYRGSLKHKLRPSNGEKGTICPEWTHATASVGLGVDMGAHDWSATIAHDLFEHADESPSLPGRKFSTKQGMAFTAKETNDGTWHGFPVPWEEVPIDLKNAWKAKGWVKGKDLRRYTSKAVSGYKWPLESDDD